MITVIDIPIKSSNSPDGWHSALSSLQMPNGVRVGALVYQFLQNANIQIGYLVKQ